MADFLEINGVPLEFESDVSFNFQVLNLDNLEERGIETSQYLYILNSSEARRAFQFPNVLNANNTSFEDFHQCKLSEREGLFKITNYSQKEIEGIFSSNTTEFYSKIDRNLRDLELSQFDFVYPDNTNSATYQFLSEWVQAGAAENAFIWGEMIQLEGKDDANQFLEITRPQYRLKRILREILEQAGYELLGSDIIDNDGIVDTLCLQSNTDDFKVTSYEKVIDATLSSGYDFEGGTTYKSEDLTINVNEFTIITPQQFVLKGDIEVLTATASILIRDSGGNITQRTDFIKSDTFTNIYSDEIKNGETITIEIEGSFRFNGRFFNLIEESNKFVPEPGAGFTNYLEGYFVKADYNLPDTSQLTLLRQIRLLYFGLEVIDAESKTVELRSYNQLNTAVSSINELEYNEVIEAAPTSFFARLNTFAYTNDDDISSDLGSFTLTKASQTTAETKEMIKHETAASGNVVLDNVFYAYIPTYYYQTDDMGGSRDPVRRSYNSRFLKLSKTDPMIISWEGLAWNILYNTYYKPILSRLLRERTIEVEALITRNEFFKMKDNPIIYIDQFQAYFFVLNITGFKDSSQITTFECMLLN